MDKTQEEINQLKQQVSDLTKKVNDLYSLTNLPDSFISNLVSKGFLKANLKIDYTSASNNLWRNIFVDFLNSNVVLTGVDKAYYVKFTADTSDTCTADGSAPENNTQVYIISTGTLPSPLVETTPYYIINSSGSTFKLSTTLGGSAVNITTVGSGAHYLQIQ